MNKLFSLLIGFVFILGCKEPTTPVTKCFDPTDPKCENYDPCLMQDSTSAFFSMKEQLSPIPPNSQYYVEDSVFLGQAIKFSALQKDAIYYKWYLGTEIVEGPTDSAVIRHLSNPVDLPLGSYDASLVIVKESDSTCFPLDDGMDSVTRIFYKVDKKDLKVVNRFVGEFEKKPGEQAQIEIAYLKEDPSDPNSEYIMVGINLQNNGDTMEIWPSLSGLVNTRAVWIGGADLEKLSGELRLNPNNDSVFFEYSLLNVFRSFRGKIYP